MRIYFIGSKGIPSSAIPGAGGVERHVEQIAIRLAARDHEVFVYSRSHANNGKQKQFEGVNVIQLPSIKTKNLDTISHVILSTIHVLFQKADVIHYHGVGPATLAWIPRLFKRNSTVFVTFHSRDWFDSKWSWPARLYLKYGEWAAVHYPHFTIVISHVLQVLCRKKWRKETVYIPNGTELISHQGSEHVKALGLEPGKYFLSVGRLVPNKAYDVAMRAFKNVKTDFQYVIAGAPYYAEEHVLALERLAEKDDRVRLIGYQSGKALRELYYHAYAFIHPSRREGLSVAIIEAMSAGKVVIMSDIKENLELIDHSGIAFPLDDEAELAKEVRFLLDHPELARDRGAKAREVVKNEYSWERVVDALVHLYHDAKS
jgi:glycosyltransferase involved in cell wall biosynthesis